MNMIGLGFLSRFLVTVDFPKGVMYLKKGRRFNEPDYWDRTGLHLIRTGGKTVIHSVDKESPAATSGLRPGDAVDRIAGTAADKNSLFQLRRILSTADKQVRVTVQRGDQRIEAILRRPAGGRGERP